MDRRKFLIGTGSIAVGGAAVVGSGAFTSVSANRSVTVDTTGDLGALLQIRRAEDEDGNTTANAEDYVSFSDGKAQIDIPNANYNATTHVRKLLDIVNTGNKDIVIGHEQDPGENAGVYVYHDHKDPFWDDGVSQAGDEVDGWPDPDSEPGISLLDHEQWGNYAYIGAGEKLKFFGMSLFGDDPSGEVDLTIVAATPEEFHFSYDAPAP